jgi:hypothetical protein
MLAATSSSSSTAAAAAAIAQHDPATRAPRPRPAGAGLGDVHGPPRQQRPERHLARDGTSTCSVAPRAAGAQATKPPPGDGAGLARALLGITDPAERDAIIASWRARRPPGGTGAV